MRSHPTRAIGSALATAAVLLMTGHADAAATSRLGCKPKPGGAKSISPESITTPGDGQIPLGITQLLSARLRISDPLMDSTVVMKTTLSPQEAYGAGLPGGYGGGGPFNPSGPWVGLMWPYRDFADGYITGPAGVPRGNDVGTIVMTSPGEFVVDGIAGAMSYSPDVPSSYMRGLVGNGATDYATFFSVDIIPASMAERDIRVTLDNVQFQVLQRNEITGQITTAIQQTAPVVLLVHIPAPGSALVFLGLVPLAARRRR